MSSLWDGSVFDLQKQALEIAAAPISEGFH
jgi:hypothetical protein